jgi:hypothetical protein
MTPWVDYKDSYLLPTGPGRSRTGNWKLDCSAQYGKNTGGPVDGISLTSHWRDIIVLSYWQFWTSVDIVQKLRIPCFSVVTGLSTDRTSNFQVFPLINNQILHPDVTDRRAVESGVITGKSVIISHSHGGNWTRWSSLCRFLLTEWMSGNRRPEKLIHCFGWELRIPISGIQHFPRFHRSLFGILYIQ